MDSRPAKVFIDSVNNLRDLGLSHLDLPRVALVGLSNAKANVLEAILGFAPDSSRHGCFFEYRLFRGESPWSCRIFVRSISKDGGPLQRAHTRFLGNVITKKTDLPVMMRRAQIAALNPSIPIPSILSMSPDEMDKYLMINPSLACAQNTVCLELNGTDLTDLTLVEMPDLDLSFEQETRRLMENLILNQLQGKCIIVAAVPLNEDIISKRALHLARSVDPDGARTIGVLANLTEQCTPDSPNSALKLGYYYITPYHDRSKLGEKKKAVERPVAKILVSSSSSHEQNGTELLEVALSLLLVELIRETMPLLRVDVICCLDQCRQEIASLPPTVTEPATFMLVILTRLSDDIHQVARGSGEPSPLLEQIHEFYADLNLAIRRTAPNFVPVLRSSPVTRDIINYLSDDEMPFEGAGLVSPFYLDDMRRHITAYATRDLLSQFPYQAKKSLIESFQKQWASLVSECLERVVGSLVKLVINRVQVICQGHELLADHLRSLLGELIRHHLNVCSEYLEAILEIELTPYTQQRHFLNICSENWLSKYRDIRKGRIGTNQRLSNPLLASKNTTVTPSSQVQSVGFEAVAKSNESIPCIPRSSDDQPVPLQGAKNSPKDWMGQPSSTQKAYPQDTLSLGSDSPTLSTSTNLKVTEAPKSPSLFVNTRPKVPANAFAFGFTESSEALNTAAANLSNRAFSLGAKTPTSFSFPTFSETKNPLATLGPTPASKDSVPNATPTASTTSILSTPALPPVMKKTPALKDLPFPISQESTKSTKAKTTDEPFKTIPSQPPTLVSATLNAGTDDANCTSKDPEADYRIALSALSRLGFTGLTRADLGKLGTVDEYEDELKLMADVRGYFQIASMRVVDYVPALIGLKFVRAVSSDILPFFMEKMGLGRPNANDICATYFAEDAEIAVIREELSSIQMRLEGAQLELYKLGI